MAVCGGKDEGGIGEAVAGGKRGALIKQAGGNGAASFPGCIEQEKVELARIQRSGMLRNVLRKPPADTGIFVPWPACALGFRIGCEVVEDKRGRCCQKTGTGGNQADQTNTGPHFL
jgi:hypothetical protein